ncbi:MAG: CGNR zinc finger domain-containing protein [Candidatus Dormibacteraceae bacterium]
MVAVDLVNTLAPGWERGRERRPWPPEQLVAAASGLVGRGVTGAEAAALLAATEELGRVFEAADRGDVDGAALTINRLVGEYRPAPLLARHDGEPWHLHFHGPEGGVADWVTGCVVALAYLVGSPEWPRLGVCSAGRCDRVFFDRSRNAGRRFCSAACQSRTKAATFRARQRATR